MARFIRSIAFWLGLANLLTALLRLPVLGWLANRRRDATAGLALAGLMLAGQRPTLWALPLALPLQLAAASLRGRWYHPLAAFTPGPAGNPLGRCTAVALPLAAGAVLPGLLLRPATASAAGVVVCHGAGNDKTKYAWRMLTALVDSGLTVLAIDLDGHGENQRRLRIPGIEENVQVAVDYLRGECAQVGLVGVSLGGCVAARAVADGVQVDALAVVEAPVSLDLASLPYRWSEFRGLWRPAFWRATDRVTPLQLLQAWGGRMESEHSLGAHFDLLDLRSALPRIACPLVLIYGTDDVIAPFAPIQALLAQIPNAALHLHGGATHLSLTMESPPLEDLAAWLGRHLRQAG
jgi:pimeloyl-ACP methyl ester carboxylesterase